MQGQRYRVELGPTVGDINYTTLLGDYRRYLMPFSFYTVAVRTLHYGRYGAGGEDPRLYPLYLGYPTLVRGYDVNTFRAGECLADATSTCPAIDRLIGSRMLVGNLNCGGRCSGHSAGRARCTGLCRSSWRRSPTVAWP